jgi:hypothetical protein
VNVLQAERAATAKLRFFVYRGQLRDTYRFSVCDAHKTPGSRTLAQFKDEKHAERFRRLIVSDYIRGRIQ